MKYLDFHKVAEYLISKSVPGTEWAMTHLKLQKLMYYVQSFHLALADDKLFIGRIEAWVHGPVCPDLYREYSNYGAGEISPSTCIDFSEFDNNQKVIIDSVWKAYGHLSGAHLETLTHREDPWNEARKKAGVSYWQACNEEITDESMKKYYKRFLKRKS